MSAPGNSRTVAHEAVVINIAAIIQACRFFNTHLVCYPQDMSLLKSTQLGKELAVALHVATTIQTLHHHLDLLHA